MNIRLLSPPRPIRFTATATAAAAGLLGRGCAAGNGGPVGRARLLTAGSPADAVDVVLE